MSSRFGSYQFLRSFFNGLPDDTLPNHITLFNLAVDLRALREEQRERIKTALFT
ncbi:hypothetical protein [Nitrosomonas communis]|uniref:Uncharacterized protein n=1 Tax=Nitrosomonas communis TaxID=44574 RepID=A0A1I4VZQ6_9PROT|nr:hypothetical protein [Nitrosomonas communis]SFN06635.1 hypothetical protein SAMN05421863_10944 [Nitrosomonas communis]